MVFQGKKTFYTFYYIIKIRFPQLLLADNEDFHLSSNILLPRYAINNLSHVAMLN